jgi:DNA repair protein RadC
MKVQRAELPATLAGHAAASRFFAECFGEARSADNRLWVAHLDRGARCIALGQHRGDIRDGDVPLEEILADAARLGSAGVILAHRDDEDGAHPGVRELRATRTLASAGEALDMAVVDHLVFAPSGTCRSYRRMGLI